MKNVLFLGQKWIGQRCFRRLLEADKNFHVAGCVSNSSTDVWWRENTIWNDAQKRSIPCVDNNRRNTDAIIDLIEQHSIDTILSVQHPWILPGKVLQLVSGQAFNIHNAPLPAYQGHNACNHALLNDETKFCSTLHWMTDLVDEGAIVREQWFDVTSSDTAMSLYTKGIAAAEKLFSHLLDLLSSDSPIERREIVGEATFYPRTSIETCRKIDNSCDPETTDRYARAFYFPPFEPAYRQVACNKEYVFPQGSVPYDFDSN